MQKHQKNITKCTHSLILLFEHWEKEMPVEADFSYLSWLYKLGEIQVNSTETLSQDFSRCFRKANWHNDC